MRAIINKIQGNERTERIDSGVWALRSDGEVKEYHFTLSVSEAKRWMKERKIRWIRLKFDDMEKEKRVLDTEFRIETRDDKQMVEGIAAVFNRLSEDLGGFREKIDPGAFDDVMNNDVRALINHEPNLVLGRTTAGTLELFVTPEGLGYRYSDPDTSYSRDLQKSLKRGDVNQSSFAFSIPDGGDVWEKDGDAWIRTIKKVSRLYDVSPVTYPAYPDTKVAARSLEAREKDIENEQTEAQRKLEAQKELVRLEHDLMKITALSGNNF